MVSASNCLGYEVRPLRDVVGRALTISELAALTSVSKSTLSRLWDTPTWVDRKHYVTVARLSVVVPGVAEYTRWVMQTERLAEAISTAQQAGFDIDLPTARRVSHQVSPVRLALVLDAASAFARGDFPAAFRCLDLSWGSASDPSVSLVFESSLIKNRQELLSSVLTAIGRQRSKEASWSGIGHSISTHKLVKAGATLPSTDASSLSGSTRLSPFELRSRTIGKVMASNDYDLVDAYRTTILANPLSHANEVWSLATYSADISTNEGASKLPRTMSLRRTSGDIITDLASVNGAYAYYLARVAIPTLTLFDPGFGGRRQQLLDTASSAASRAEGVGDRQLTEAASAILLSARRSRR